MIVQKCGLSGPSTGSPNHPKRLNFDEFVQALADEAADEAFGSRVPTCRQIVQGFAMLNPHAQFILDGETWEPTNPGWEKWKPDNPTSPHWYTSEQLRSLIAAYVSADRSSGKSRTIREFVAEFRGLSRTAIQKDVTHDAALHGASLTALVSKGDISMPRVERLLSAMKEHSKPVNPKLLGTIGREHLTSRMVSDYGVQGELVKYCRTVGDDYVLEVAFGIYREEFEKNGRTLITGLNWSPTMDTPICEINYASTQMSIGRGDPVCAVVHIAKPHFEFTERGKGHANV